MKSISERQKLGWLEFARGMAALLVVISHGSLAGVPERFWPFTVPLGSAAVAFFFVLSGFIIFYVHSGDIGRPDRAANYTWRRVVRIFPTYWLVFAIDIGLHLAVNNRVDMPELSLQPIAHELLLLPGGRLYISVAWTLRHELLFYALFLVLILNRRAGLLLLGCWLVTILYVLGRYGWIDDLSRPPMQMITSPMNLCFFVGIAIAAFGDKYVRLLDGLEPPTFSCWFGAISYPLYLSHFTTYFVLAGVFKRLGVEPEWPWRLSYAIVASLLAATVISRMYEQPLLDRLRKLGSNKLRDEVRLARAEHSPG
jgi:peptidoglycan/LPS O-acetylase OafA/YrhL